MKSANAVKTTLWAIPPLLLAAAAAVMHLIVLSQNNRHAEESLAVLDSIVQLEVNSCAALLKSENRTGNGQYEIKKEFLQTPQHVSEEPFAENGRLSIISPGDSGFIKTSISLDTLNSRISKTCRYLSISGDIKFTSRLTASDYSYQMNDTSSGICIVKPIQSVQNLSAEHCIEHTSRIGTIHAAAAAVFSAALLILIAVSARNIAVRRHVTDRIRILNSILNKEWVDNTDFLAIKGNDEIGQLAESFQTMSRQLHRRIEMEQLIAEVSQQLAGSREETVAETLAEALRRLGIFSQADRTNILLINDTRTALEPAAQWCRNGITPVDLSAGVSISEFPWLMNELHSGKAAQFSSMHQLPPEASSEREYWNERTRRGVGAQALIIQPIHLKGDFIGFISCEMVVGSAEWNSSDIQLLAMLSEVFASGIDRFRTEKLVRIQNQQLLQAQKMETVGHLAGGIAHDFNNILAGIVSITSLFRMEHEHSENISKEALTPFLDTIQNAGSRAARVVQQLLLLSRKQEYHFTAVDLNKIIRQVVEMGATSFDKTISIYTDLAEGQACTRADAVQIEQVLLNFAMNAVHAMTIMRKPGEPVGGVLTITSSRVEADKKFRKTHPIAFENEYWKITIGDTGVGIPEEYYSRIFDPFFTTKEKGVGTGLGLSMIYRIVQEHYGFVEFVSELGKGTTFTIYLPYEKSEESEHPAEPVPAPTPAVRKQALVLVVDDEPLLRKIAGRILESCGHKVITAENGGEAVDIFEERSSQIDAVILDLVMPVLGGRETYLELKKIKPSIPVLISSGFRKDERVDEMLQLGAAGFLQKPYTVEEMRTQINHLLSL